jgi:hypothetical protein
VDRLDYGQPTATPIAPVNSEPYNYVGRLPRNTRDGYTSLDDVVIFTSYTQNEPLTQAQVDESVRQDCGASEHAVHNHNAGPQSTPEAGLDHEMTTLETLGQHDLSQTYSGAPWDIGDQTAVQFDPLDLSQEAEHLEAPEVLREATAFDTSPQVGITPALPPPQHYPLGQSAFGQPTYVCARPHPEHGYCPINHEGYFDREHSTIAGLGHYATGQDYGGQNNDEYFLAAQDPEGMPPPVHRQRRSGPQQSFETGLSSSSNHNSGPR